MNDTPDKPKGLSFEDLANNKPTPAPKAESSEAAAPAPETPAKAALPKPPSPIGGVAIPRPPKPTITAPASPVKPKIGGIKIGDQPQEAPAAESAAPVSPVSEAKPDASITFDEPKKSSAGTSVVAIAIDAVAALVAIGFTVVMAIEILPFLK